MSHLLLSLSAAIMNDKKILSEFLPSGISTPPKVTRLDQILTQSNEFDKKVCKFPIQSVRCKELVKVVGETQLLANINGAYPIVHEKVLVLMADFLRSKLQNGSSVEKKMYKDMTLPSFVHRLLSKRPLVFVGGSDSYLLRGPEKTRGRGGFETIGTDREKAPLIMKDYLTYDEMKISALLATSSFTVTINSGSRCNLGKHERDPSKFERNAVIVGLVGTRYQKLGYMESQDSCIHPDQNLETDVYYSPEGNPFSRFYGIDRFPIYSDIHPEQNSEKIFPLTTLPSKSPIFFNLPVYESRIKVTAETLLIEAEHRAKSVNKMAYVHVVGLGLGVWKLVEDQCGWYVNVFGRVLRDMKPMNISDIDFSWIPVESCDGVPDGGYIGKTRIRISKRNLFDKLDSENKIIVSSWAYDGNSYPGNEFWSGNLAGSGDPQVACSTQVAELHNPLINPVFCGKNLRVASLQNGIQTFHEYCNSLNF